MYKKYEKSINFQGGIYWFFIFFLQRYSGMIVIPMGKLSQNPDILPTGYYKVQSVASERAACKKEPMYFLHPPAGGLQLRKKKQ